jgi:hypothetical protein
MSVIGFAFEAAACANGVGRHIYYLSAEQLSLAMHYLFVMYCVWVIAVGLVRISAACLLLRIIDTHFWRLTLWTLITIQTLSIIAASILQLIECRPLRAMWDVVEDAQCWTPAQMHIWSYVYSSKSFCLIS